MDDTLAGWLARHGYGDESVASQCVLARCDTLEELQALTDADFDAMTELKLGARRALQVKVASSQSSHRSSQSVDIPAAVSPTKSNGETSSSSSSFANENQQRRVAAFLEACDGRVIYGRLDKTKELSPFEKAMNSAAIDVLKTQPHVISWDGANLIKSVKTGKLIEAAKASVNSSYDFAHGQSRSASCAENTDDVTARKKAATSARISSDIRSQQLVLIPSQIKQLEVQLENEKKLQKQHADQGRFQEAVKLGEQISSKLMKLSSLKLSLQSHERADEKSQQQKQRVQASFGVRVDSRPEEEESRSQWDQTLGAQFEHQGGIRKLCMEASLSLTEAELAGVENLVSQRTLMATWSREEQFVGTGDTVENAAQPVLRSVRVSPISGLDLEEYINYAKVMCKLMCHQPPCQCSTELAIAKHVLESFEAGRPLTAQDAWKGTHNGASGKDAQKIMDIALRAPIIAFLVAPIASAPGAWQLVPKIRGLNLQAFSMLFSRIIPRSTHPLATPLNVRQVKALCCATTTDANRRLIQAAVCGSLSKKDLDAVSGGNSCRWKRQSRETIEVASDVLDMHQALRLLAQKDALIEAGTCFGLGVLTEADIIAEASSQRASSQEELEDLAQHDSYSPLVTIDFSQGGLVSGLEEKVHVCDLDDADAELEAQSICKDIEKWIPGRLHPKNMAANSILGRDWLRHCELVLPNEEDSDDITSLGSDSGSDESDSSEDAENLDKIDASSVCMANALAEGDPRRVVLGYFVKQRREKNKQSSAFRKAKLRVLSRPSGYQRKQNILAKYPNIGDVCMEVLESLNTGADAWRKDSNLVIDTSKKRVKGSGVSALVIGLKARGIEVNRTTARYLGRSAKSKSAANSKYKNIASFCLRRNVKRLGAISLDAHAQRAMKKSNEFVQHLIANSDNVTWFERDDMASQSMNCAVRNASTSLVPTSSPHGINKYEYTTPGATSIQATTYRAGSIGTKGSPEINIMVIRTNAENPSSPHQHYADDLMLRALLKPTPGEIVSPNSLLFYDSNGELKRNIVQDVDNGKDECVRRSVRVLLLAELMLGGPGLDPTKLLASIQLTSLAPNDTYLKTVERVNGAAHDSISSFMFDVDQYASEVESIHNDETGHLDPIKVERMHHCAGERYRAQIDGTPGINGATILALPCAKKADDGDSRLILERAPVFDMLCSQNISKAKVAKIKEEHPGHYERFLLLKERSAHWGRLSHYKVSLELCDAPGCDICRGHPKPGSWGESGTPKVSLLPYAYQDPERPGHYKGPREAIIAHAEAQVRNDPPPKPPSVKAAEMFKEQRKEISPTEPVSESLVGTVVAALNDSSCSAPEVRKYLDRLRLSQLRRIAGAAKAQQTIRSRKGQEEPAPEGDNGSDEDINDERASAEDASEQQGQGEVETRRKVSVARRGSDDESLAKGESVAIAWPDDSVYVGKVVGRPSVFQALDLLASDSPESKAAAFPLDRKFARIVVFDDGDKKCLCLHPSREVRDPSAVLVHGHWRRISVTTAAETEA